MPTSFISIDPGDIHVGWVRWEDNYPVHLEELTPERCVEEMQKCSDEAVIALEDWRLYPDKANTMIGSDMPTCQLIGVIKHLAGERGIPVLLQGAGIKNPTKGVLRNKDIKLISKEMRLSDHVQDAELHGYHFMLNGFKRFERAFGIPLRKTA